MQQITSYDLKNIRYLKIKIYHMLCMYLKSQLKYNSYLKYQMNQLIQYYCQFRRLFCGNFIQYFPPHYRVINRIQNKTQQQQRYIDYMENSFTFHISSFIFTAPCLYFSYRYIQQRNKLLGGDPRKQLIRILIYSTIAFNLLMQSLYFDKVYSDRNEQQNLIQKYRKQIAKQQFQAMNKE